MVLDISTLSALAVRSRFAVSVPVVKMVLCDVRSRLAWAAVLSPSALHLKVP